MTKRTRKRTPKPKPPPPPVEVSDVDVAADQLAAMWPQLQHAVARDSAGLGSSDGIRGSANVHASVMNVDVVEALMSIRDGVSEIEAQAERLLHLDHARRPTGAVIDQLGDWHRSLDARKQPLAQDIEQDIARWVRTARAALRLDTRARPLGELCPFHRDTDPTEMLVDPDQATLHEALLDGRRPPETDAPLTWKYSDAISCPQCKQRWSGLAQLRVLGQLLRRANTTTTPQQDRHHPIGLRRSE